ncbi:MAG TPA: DUF1800 domain-containing protein, partial [Vicinamibacterales bacterium]|nr:DUF1800 domain-containing protein [Vicinamibacterales bacterium]
RLAGFTTLDLSIDDISRDYERPQQELQRKFQQQQSANVDPNAPRPPAVMAAQQKAGSVLQEMAQQKLIRAIYSERQLQEVLTDFWFNHFNVDARKGRDRFMLTAYERDAIRPHVLGTFRDLLGATAKSPAMLFYLDNWLSTDPNGPHANPVVVRRGPFGRPILVAPRPPANANTQRRGLNENYGRELMELHTLGVDGGYTQKDVTEVARAFTGWTIENPKQGGEFRFEPRAHDEGEKVVLGHRIHAGGVRDGEEVLDILASQPSTAHFIAFELARRFVSDTPPPALVDRLAQRFRDTNGDLREVMRAMLTSPEFFAPEAYGAKVKTPLEFVVSAARTLGAQVDDARPLVNQLQQLGMPLYQCQPPTGYKDTADAWTNTGALVARMNLALQMSGGKMKGISVVRPPSAVVSGILNDDASETTRATIAKATTPPQMMALALGSPEFQKR